MAIEENNPLLVTSFINSQVMPGQMLGVCWPLQSWHSLYQVAVCPVPPHAAETTFHSQAMNGAVELIRSTIYLLLHSQKKKKKAQNYTLKCFCWKTNPPGWNETQISLAKLKKKINFRNQIKRFRGNANVQRYLKSSFFSNRDLKH